MTLHSTSDVDKLNFGAFTAMGWLFECKDAATGSRTCAFQCNWPVWFCCRGDAAGRWWSAALSSCPSRCRTAQEADCAGCPAHSSSYIRPRKWVTTFFSEIGWIDVNVLFITSKNTFHPALSPGKVWTMHLPVHNGFLPIFSVLVLVGQALCCLPQALSVRYKPQNEQNTVYYCWKPQN